MCDHRFSHRGYFTFILVSRPAKARYSRIPMKRRPLITFFQRATSTSPSLYSEMQFATCLPVPFLLVTISQAFPTSVKNPIGIPILQRNSSMDFDINEGAGDTFRARGLAWSPRLSQIDCIAATESQFEPVDINICRPIVESLHTLDYKHFLLDQTWYFCCLLFSLHVV